MIFQLEHIQMIQNGKKTETRRIWKFPHVSIGNYYPIMRNYREKHREEDGYIRIRNVVHVYLEDLDSKSAVAEGGYTVEQFKEIWKKINGEWNPRQDIWWITFDYAPAKPAVSDGRTSGIRSDSNEKRTAQDRGADVVTTSQPFSETGGRLSSKKNKKEQKNL